MVDAGTEEGDKDAGAMLPEGTDSAQQKEGIDGNSKTVVGSSKEGQGRGRNLTGLVMAGIIALAGIGAGVFAILKKKKEGK